MILEENFWDRMDKSRQEMPIINAILTLPNHYSQDRIDDVKSVVEIQ